MSKRQVGGYEFKYECTRIRSSSTAINQALTQILETNPGPQTMAMLVAKMAVENSTINSALTNIERIGNEEKKKRT
jgi:predicted transcriptional regulator